MIKVSLWILFVSGLAYGCFCLFVFLRQRSLIFYPQPAAQSKAADVLWLENDDERLKVWQVRNDSQTALIYFGGNAEDVALNIVRFKVLFSGLSLYLMNYRGYGGSTGRPTEEGLFSDGRALYEHVAATHRKVVVMGRSLGTAVAVHLAAQKSVDGAILVTPYSSMVDLARHYYPFLPVRPLLKDRFDSTLEAPGIDIPVLALVAEHDDVIPGRISDKLVDSFKPEMIQKVVVKGACHNSIDTGPGYDMHLLDFIKGLFPDAE